MFSSDKENVEIYFKRLSIYLLLIDVSYCELKQKLWTLSKKISLFSWNNKKRFLYFNTPSLNLAHSGSENFEI